MLQGAGPLPAETAAPKYCLGNILTLLAFGPVSLRLLDLGVPEAGGHAIVLRPATAAHDR